METLTAKTSNIKPVAAISTDLKSKIVNQIKKEMVSNQNMTAGHTRLTYTR